eukprot:157964-Lingulodinium_polyedra.AAC.1
MVLQSQRQGSAAGSWSSCRQRPRASAHAGWASTARSPLGKKLTAQKHDLCHCSAFNCSVAARGQAR